MDQKEYWDNKIKVWSESIYNSDSSRKSIPLVEKVAAYFRKPIKNRHSALIDYLGKNIIGSSFLDLGCGVGELSFDLLKNGAKSVIGVDISPSVIEHNNQRKQQLNIDDKLNFVTLDIRNNIEIPTCEIVVGLGFIDYLNLGELAVLFKKIEGRKFIFSFPEKKINLINILQSLYLRWQGCPGFFKFTKKELHAISDKPLFFPQQGRLVFVSNFKV